MKAIMDFFSPNPPQQQKKQQVIVQQQKKQQGKQQTKQDTGIIDFFVPKQPQQTKQQQFVLQQQKKQMPPLKESSQVFEPVKQFQIADQVADQIVGSEQIKQVSGDIIKQVSKQTQQSRQQLAKTTKQGVPDDIEKARKAHQQILEYSNKIKSLLAEIHQNYQLNRIQTQQTNNRLKKKDREASIILSELKNMLDQMNTMRQQTQRAQQSHIRQLQQIKQKLLEPNEPKVNKKIVQYDTPDGNKLKIQVSVHPESKCCVAKSLSQQSRTYLHVPQQRKLIL